MWYLRLFVCMAPVLLVGTGCDEKLSDVTGPTPDLTPTFASIQRDILGAPDSSGRPGCNSCHVPGGPANGTGLFFTDATTSYALLVGRPSRLKPGETLVIPGDPANSYLVRKLDGGPDINGQRMPRTSGPFLTEGQMLVIRRWIQDGAANN